MSERSRFAKFVIAGGLAAAVNVVTRYLLSTILVYEAAVAIAYLFGMTAAFLLNRAFVFERSASGVHVQYSRFALVNALAFIQVWLISVGLNRIVFPDVGFVWHPETVAHIIGVVSPVLTSYLGHKHFSFR
jgi:putative flippase GtrA